MKDNILVSDEFSYIFYNINEKILTSDIKKLNKYEFYLLLIALLDFKELRFNNSSEMFRKNQLKFKSEYIEIQKLDHKDVMDPKIDIGNKYLKQAYVDSYDRFISNRFGNLIDFDSKSWNSMIRNEKLNKIK